MKEEDFYNIIGQNIKKYRNEYNKKYGKMTQELLAEKLNTSVSFISKLESKRTYQSISIPTLYKISIILKIPIDKLIKGDTQ
ncbi:MAG: helix-turn-helix transcriptional regulator [Bacilli bacterium]|nr:helix-turn-helix transcriptional regulator [Bacilli bacterium]